MHVINSTDWMLTGSGFWDCFENVLKFLPSVSIYIDYVFMSIRNSGAQFLCVLFETIGARCAPQRNAHLVILFSEIMNQIVYLKWALAVCKTCQFFTLQGNMNFQFTSLWSIATQLSLCTLFCASQCLSKGCLVHDTNVHKIFLAPEIFYGFYQGFHL